MIRSWSRMVAQKSFGVIGERRMVAGPKGQFRDKTDPARTAAKNTVNQGDAKRRKR